MDNRRVQACLYPACSLFFFPAASATLAAKVEIFSNNKINQDQSLYRNDISNLLHGLNLPKYSNIDCVF